MSYISSSTEGKLFKELFLRKENWEKDVSPKRQYSQAWCHMPLIPQNHFKKP
jgi:hypothetical protein